MKGNKQQPEYALQKQICMWLRLQYPDIMFLSDTIAATKLTFGQQQRNKAIQKPDFKCPDLLILFPNIKYHGLFIELKVSTPYKKDGTIKASTDDHLKLQEATLSKLNNLGYFATFAWSFEQAQHIINTYLLNNYFN